MPGSAARPLVSVVTSVYNGGRFLDEALASIRGQTYTNFEFIIIDDGSKDATPNILARHAGEDPRIRVLSQENRGLIESLHRGFAAATGPYIARMDADDVAKPDRLRIQVDFLDSNPGIALVGGAVEVIDADSQVRDVIHLPSQPDRIRTTMRELGCAVAHPTVLFRRSVLAELGGFRHAYRHAEDYDLWLRMLDKYDVANLDQVLIGYRRHMESVSYKHCRQQALSSLGARAAARLRLRGSVDPTSGVDLITEEVLRDLGVQREAIDEAIFSGFVTATENAVQCGLSSAAAEFFRAAQPYADADRLRRASLDLNRRALNATSSLSERRRHRTLLMTTDPTTYWELFGQACDSDPSNRRPDGVDMTRPTLSEILRQRRYDTDKSDEYLRLYERAWRHLRDAPIALLEVGVNKGGSLYLWRDYFARGEIFGVDLHPPADLSDPTGRIRVFQGDQGNSSAMDAIAAKACPSGFHVIIDDASHVGHLTAATFRALFYKHLRPGGLYAIEDWGTGYWESWPDGSKPAYHDAQQFQNLGHQFSSHQSGMVGFLKQLIDECALPDILHPKFGVSGSRRSYIRSICLCNGLAIIEKSLE